MNLQKWIDSRSAELQAVLTQEARQKGLLGKDHVISCKLERKPDVEHEPVYPVILADTEKQQIISGNWRPTAAGILQAVLTENPKEFKYVEGRCWWEQSYQSSINSAFREAKLPWRIIKIGVWNEGKVHLGSTIPNSAEPIGTIIAFKPKKRLSVF